MNNNDIFIQLVENRDFQKIKRLLPRVSQDTLNESLGIAISLVDVEMVKFLLDRKHKKRSDPFGVRSELQLEPIFNAVSSKGKRKTEDNIKIVNILLNNGVDINMKNYDGSTPLMYACSYGDNQWDIEMVRFLIDHGADVNAQNYNDNTALIYASSRGYYDIVKLLLESYAHVNTKNKQGNTALMEASKSFNTDTNVMNKYTLITQILLGYGAEVDERDRYGQTSLYIATLSGNISVIKVLLNSNADVNIADNNRNTPLMVAVEKSSLEVVELLLEAGADVNAQNYNDNTALMYASSRGYYDIVKLLLESYAHVNTKNKQGNTALMEASKSFNTDTNVMNKYTLITQILLGYDAKIDERDRYGQTSLYIATRSGNISVIKVLLNSNADVNIADNNRNTPLMVAVEKSSLEVVQLLLEAGADVKAQNRFGETVSDIASEKLNDSEDTDYENVQEAKTIKELIDINLRIKTREPVPFQSSSRALSVQSKTSVKLRPSSPIEAGPSDEPRFFGQRDLYFYQSTEPTKSYNNYRKVELESIFINLDSSPNIYNGLTKQEMYQKLFQVVFKDYRTKTPQRQEELENNREFNDEELLEIIRQIDSDEESLKIISELNMEEIIMHKYYILESYGIKLNDIEILSRMSVLERQIKSNQIVFFNNLISEKYWLNIVNYILKSQTTSLERLIQDVGKVYGIDLRYQEIINRLLKVYQVALSKRKVKTSNILYELAIPYKLKSIRTFHEHLSELDLNRKDFKIPLFKSNVWLTRIIKDFNLDVCNFTEIIEYSSIREPYISGYIRRKIIILIILNKFRNVTVIQPRDIVYFPSLESLELNLVTKIPITIFYGEELNNTFLFYQPDLLSNIYGCRNRFIFVDIAIVPLDIVVAHAVSLMIDQEKKEIEFFDPNGYVIEFEHETYILFKFLENALKNMDPYFRDFSFIYPLDECPPIGPQSVSRLSEAEEILRKNYKMTEGGFCQTWTRVYSILRLMNPELTREDILYYLLSLKDKEGDENLASFIFRIIFWINDYVPNTTQEILNFIN